MRRGSLVAAVLLLLVPGLGRAEEGAGQGRAPEARGADRARRKAPVRSARAPEAEEPSRQGAVSAQGRGEEPATEPRVRARRLRPEDLRRLLRRFSNEPSVERVQAAAIRLVLADPGRPAAWLRRAPRAAWLPSVSLGAGVQQRRDRRLDKEVGSPDLFRADATNQIAYEIKLSWDLSRLIFEPNTLRVAREAQRIAELREQVVLQVTRLYFERRRLQLEIATRPVITASAALGREMRLAELTAVLNAMTGGLFRRARPGSR